MVEVGRKEHATLVPPGSPTSNVGVTAGTAATISTDTVATAEILTDTAVGV